MIKKNFDKILLISALILLVTGFFILFSASLGLKNRTGATFDDIIIKQLLFGVVVGSILAFIASHIEYHKWKKHAFGLFVFSFVLNALVFIPDLASTHGGASRWLSVLGFSFQPSELLKFSFIVFLASWLSSKKEDIKSFNYGLVPFIAMVGFVGAVIVAQRDIGTLGVLALTSLALFFLAGGKIKHIILMILMGILALAVLIKLEPYRMSRLEVFMNPDQNQQGSGWQLKQSKIAIGTGGITGLGFGTSVQKFGSLPEPIGDSIFSVFSEEFGLVGGIVLLSFFLFFAHRGILASKNAPDSFGRLLGSGIVILIITQVFINIGSMLGLVPITGIPLLFVSQGGSALAMVLLEVGVLLNISKHKN